MNSEKDVKAAVKKILGPVREGIWWYMPPANGFGTPGVPDLMGLVHGAGFAIETKFGPGKCTPWQEKQAAAIRAAGGKYWLVNERNVEVFSAEFAVWAMEAAVRAGDHECS